MAQSKWNPWFWFHTVVDPAHTLDLVDDQGKTDHGKIVPFLMLVVAVVAHFTERPFEIMELTILFSASFGYGMFRSFLKAGTVKRQELVETRTLKSESHHIEERRDYDHGIDPA